MRINLNRSKSKYTEVSPEDYGYLSQFKWRYTGGYAIGVINDKNVLMHRAIMEAPKNKQVDHINHNRLDNRRENLRLCNNSKNHMNMKPYKNKTSKFKGVCFWKQRNKWMAYIKKDGKLKHLGLFEKEVDAAKRYNQEAKKMFKEFAYLNNEESMGLNKLLS